VKFGLSLNDSEQGLLKLLLILSPIFALALRDSIFIHGDIGTHLSAGRHFLENGNFLLQEIWSSSAKGHRWLNMEVLWQIGAAGLEKLGGGFALLGLVTVLQLTFILCIVLLHIHKRGLRTLGAFLLLFFFVAIWPVCSNVETTLTISPRSFSYTFNPLLHLGIYLCLRNKLSSKTLAIFLVGLIPIWGMIHGAAFYSVTIIGALSLELLYKRKIKDLSYVLAGLGLGYTLLVLVHPLGIDLLKTILLGSYDPTNAFNSGTIDADLFSTEVLLYLGLVIPFYMLSVRKIGLADHVLFFFYLYMGTKSNRDLPHFVIFSLPIFASCLSTRTASFATRLPAITRVDKAFDKAMAKVSEMMPSLLTGLVFLGLLGLYLKRAPLDYPQPPFPVKAGDYVEAKLMDKSMFTDWNFGGYFIHRFNGQLPVSIDGRGARAYPLEILEHYTLIYTDPEKMVTSIEEEAVVIREALPITEILRQRKQLWKETYSDGFSVIFERREKENTAELKSPGSEPSINH